MSIEVWAHRGASGYAPENTLEAFALAAEMGADGIELDVHLTADGEVVVAHDETIARMTRGKGHIAQMTLEQLRAFHFNKGKEKKYPDARIPTLREVFALATPTKMKVNVELKNNIEPYPGLEEKCTALVREMGMAGRVWFSSFNHHSLLALKRIAPDLPCGALYEATMVKPWAYARALGLDALHPHYSELSVAGEVDACHAAGLRVHAWTINTSQHIARAAATGLDAIITNYPDRARKIVGK